MVQWDGLDTERAVFVDNLMLGGVDGMELNLIADVVVEEKVQLRLEHRLHLGRCMHMDSGRTPQQSEGREQSDESEAVVAVKMRDEDVTHLLERQLRASQLQLRPLAAVHHKQFAATLHDLH